jgi:hypothetical protein
LHDALQPPLYVAVVAALFHKIAYFYPKIGALSKAGRMCGEEDAIRASVER